MTTTTGPTKVTRRRPSGVTRFEAVADIEDGPVVPILSRYTNTGKSFQVDRVRLVFTPDDGYWVCSHLHAYGYLLKKDGTVGKAEGHNDYDGRSADIPAWVRTVIDRFTPAEPAPVIPSDGFILTLEN